MAYVEVSDNEDTAKTSKDCGRSKEVSKWSKEDVHSWLTEQGFVAEATMFEAENITGKALYCLEKADLKDIGINTMGRRLEVFEKIKELTCMQEEKASTKSEVAGQVCKKKITKEDRSTWKANDKARYLEKISILNWEAHLLWPGHAKIHVKRNASARLKMEEFIAKMEPTCSIPEIGFGRDAIRGHVLQWFHEKNRKIEDGYDYEISHKPAKCAKFRAESPSEGSSSDSNSTAS